MRSALRPGTTRLAAALFVVWAWIPVAASAAPPRPAPGRFLVATRQVQGGFAKSVILMVDYGPTGALGLIVNHPTRLLLEKLLPDIAQLQGQREAVYLGGPVSPDHLMLLIRAPTAPPDATPVTGDVYVSGSADTLRALAGKKIPHARFRAYVGYAGWAPGQLDHELERGDWVVAPANSDDVFRKDPSSLWRELIRKEGGVQVELERRDLALR